MSGKIYLKNYFHWITLGVLALFLQTPGAVAGAAETRPAGDEGGQPETHWPYEKLNVEQVRKLGHWGYYEKGCSYGAFYALLAPLQESVGAPYTGIPAHMLEFGRGGIVGEGDICGALLGSLAAINLVVDDDYDQLAEALLTYYRQTPLPTDISNVYAREREFLVAEYFTSANLVSTVAGSVTCRHSRRKWMSITGHRRTSAERQERCARLTGDVAAKAAILLNAWAMNKD